jgi:hypothetical protein
MIDGNCYAVMRISAFIGKPMNSITILSALAEPVRLKPSECCGMAASIVFAN